MLTQKPGHCPKSCHCSLVLKLHQKHSRFSKLFQYEQTRCQRLLKILRHLRCVVTQHLWNIWHLDHIIIIMPLLSTLLSLLNQLIFMAHSYGQQQNVHFTPMRAIQLSCCCTLSKWFDEKFIYWAYPKRSLYLLLWRQRGLVVTSLGVSTKLLNVGTG